MPRRSAPRSAPPIKVPRQPTPTAAIPSVIKPATTSDHLDIMTRAVFQAGLSWAIITARWDAFRDAFDRFDVVRVAAYGEFELERLMTTDKIIHSAKKIAGTIANARALLALEREFGSVDRYLATHATYAGLYTDARRRFAFLGDLNCYYWLLRTGNPVPRFEDWIARQERDHPRMRELLMLARTNGQSSERPGF